MYPRWRSHDITDIDIRSVFYSCTLWNEHMGCLPTRDTSDTVWHSVDARISAYVLYGIQSECRQSEIGKKQHGCY